jgi:hypothetical protein
MADSTDFLGGLIGTVIVGGIAMKVADRMFPSPQRPTKRTSKAKTIYAKGRARKLNHPGDFSNVLPW